jgi:hypothetical protein
MAAVLRENGYPDLRYSDIHDWGYPGTVVQDFLQSNEIVGAIVTNPPHDKPQDYVRHARKRANKVAMLLALEFESLVGSTDLRADKEFPLKAVYIFTQSIRWLNTEKVFGKIKYAWFVWEKGYCGEIKRECITFDLATKMEIDSLNGNAETL